MGHLPPTPMSCHHLPPPPRFPPDLSETKKKKNLAIYKVVKTDNLLHENWNVGITRKVLFCSHYNIEILGPNYVCYSKICINYVWYSKICMTYKCNLRIYWKLEISFLCLFRLNYVCHKISMLGSQLTLNAGFIFIFWVVWLLFFLVFGEHLVRNERLLQSGEWY